MICVREPVADARVGVAPEINPPSPCFVSRGNCRPARGQIALVVAEDA